MLNLSIPGRDKLEIKNILFDFNGTIATDGKLDPCVLSKIAALKAYLKVFVLTSDTFGTARKEINDPDIRLVILDSEHAGRDKWRIARELGAQNTICVGNGVNDADMFRVCALSILVLGDEGCAFQTMSKADIIVKSTRDALDLMLNPKRIAATLRK